MHIPVRVMRSLLKRVVLAVSQVIRTHRMQNLTKRKQKSQESESGRKNTGKMKKYGRTKESENI